MTLEEIDIIKDKNGLILDMSKQIERNNMKDKTLIVKKKNVWGTERIYPVCNKAILFSCIAASKTLCPITIANIKKLGYKFETQKEEI